MRNRKEFTELAERYETITIEEIGEANLEDPYYRARTLEDLTGFGSTRTCRLCKAIDPETGEPFIMSYACKDCAWTYTNWGVNADAYPCLSGGNAKTYNGICDARKADVLLKGYRARAKRMRTILKRTDEKLRRIQSTD